MVSERVLKSYEGQMKIQIVRPATVCGISPRMRLDVSVNMLTMQALTKGVIKVFGGTQVRPNIHIDDICDDNHGDNNNSGNRTANDSGDSSSKSSLVLRLLSLLDYQHYCYYGEHI
mgnify:CR=1 FL=1